MSGVPETNYDTFMRPPCALQAPQYSYTLPPNSSSYCYDYTSMPRPSQGFYTDQLDMSTNNWMADIEKRLKFTEKIETLEITSKDLSPASCCSNIDPAFSNNYNGTPYYYNYPSCAQSTNNFPEYEYNNVSEQYYSQPFVDINQSEECSVESDIIVEDSEECYSDDSRDLEGYILTNCVVCNIPYIPLGTHFYTLTDQTPLTMSSQRPVILKLQEMFGSKLNSKLSHLCSNCLGLVNTLDHLQLKLDAARNELLGKFKNINPNQNVSLKKHQRFKNFCGLHRFKCKICKKNFTPKQLCKAHLAKHKSRERFLCEQCGCRFVSSYNLKMHAVSHQHTIDAFMCRICEKQFRTKTNLKDHYAFCSDNYRYACCDKKFATVTKWKRHRKLKHDKKFIAICSICNIGFVKQSDYKSHKVTHSTEKKHSCIQCGKSYKTASNLNFHMKAHDKNLPYACNLCSKGFMRKEYLEAHVNKHNGVKGYTCQICKKCFASQKNLDAHLKYHEGNVKKHICNICNKVITTGFEDHLRTHSNLKEFQCETCLMKFNTKGALSKHRVRKHCNK